MYPDATPESTWGSRSGGSVDSPQMNVPPRFGWTPPGVAPQDAAPEMTSAPVMIAASSHRVMRVPSCSP